MPSTPFNQKRTYRIAVAILLVNGTTYVLISLATVLEGTFFV